MGKTFLELKYLRPITVFLILVYLPSAFAAPVASAGATFETPFTARGRSLAPILARLVNKFPPCFTERVICVWLIFKSDPVPFAK